MNSYPVSRNQLTSTERTGTLADGVFAIVLTLLILNIKSPKAASEAELAQQLLALWPEFLSYTISFAILAIFWFGHQMVSRYIRRSDRVHIWLNLLFLMCIAFIPFSTSLLGGNGRYQIAVVFYVSNLFAAGLVRYLHWRYATSGYRLVDAQMNARYIRKVQNTFLLTPLLCLLTIGISFLSVTASLVLYALIPVISAIRQNSVFRSAR